MEFGLSETQRAWQDSLNRHLETSSSLARVRRAIAGDAEVAHDMRRGLNELGVAALLIPEALGGLGLGLLDAALTHEAMGRFVAPCDMLADTLAAIALRQAGNPQVRHRGVAGLLCGQRRFSVALSHRVEAREESSVRAADGRLSGRTHFALGTADVTDFIVADDDGALWTFGRDAPGLDVVELITIDRTRRFTELRLRQTPVEPLAAPPGAADRLIAAARTLLAADTLGAAQNMLEQAVAYALERRQFGRVIGSFQAVKHLCAEMAAEIEPCRALLWYAAYAQDALPDEAALMACHAKARLADVGRFVARTATEVHGGMGFTDELGLHLWFKRIGLNRQLLGTPQRLRHEAAQLQGWVEA